MSSVYGTSAVKRSRRTNAELDALDDVILAMCAEDHPLSVRAVFYRTESAHAVEKTVPGYKAVQRRVLHLRREGRLPYAWIADGTRWTVKAPSWDSAAEAASDCAASYRRALWHNQDTYVEVWSEKEAISSILSPVTDSYDVPLMIARGFASESFLYTTAETIAAVGKPTMIYQFGDHDDSGVKAWKHIQRRLRHFAPNADLTFKRLAVTAEQIEELGLPTRPPKSTGSRTSSFGPSVEVDAIRTSVLRRILTEAIESHIDPVKLAATKLIEDEERAALRAMAEGWSA